MERITITRQVQQAMEAHALEAGPAECCGLLSGDGHVITSVYRVRNEADRPETRYYASPQDLFATMTRMRQEGETMMGIYHSHPRSPAYPSKTDVELAFYSDSIYFIVSLASQVELRAFRIEDGKTRSVEIEVIDEIL